MSTPYRGNSHRKVMWEAGQTPGAMLGVVGERTMSDEVSGNGDCLYLFAMHGMVTVQGLKQGTPCDRFGWPVGSCYVLRSGRVTGEEEPPSVHQCVTELTTPREAKRKGEKWWD